MARTEVPESFLQYWGRSIASEVRNHLVSTFNLSAILTAGNLIKTPPPGLELTPIERTLVYHFNQTGLEIQYAITIASLILLKALFPVNIFVYKPLHALVVGGPPLLY
eukprot:Filipodium_phascolosomae@DN6549_c0_g1_i1.p1